MSKNVIIIGAGGHAKVIADIVLLNGDSLIGFLDDSEEKQGKEVFKNYKVLGKVSDARDYPDVFFIIAIGDNHTRAKIAENLNVGFYTAIHPKAVVADSATIGEGTVVMAGVVINSDAIIGEHCILNTSCSIDHDNKIGHFVHVSPGAHLAGTVSVGSYSWICAGATVINNIVVGESATIGAGAVLLQNALNNKTYIGVPAKTKD